MSVCEHNIDDAYLTTLTFLYLRYFCSIWTSISWKDNQKKKRSVRFAVYVISSSFGIRSGTQQSETPGPDSTLYSCVPGERVLIFEPNWTNISVMAPIRSWRALYSSYSAQKSSLYSCRCSSAFMALYFLKKRNKKQTWEVFCHFCQ